MRSGGRLVGLLVASLLVAVVPSGQALVVTYDIIYDGPLDEAVPNPFPQACIPVSVSVIPPGYDINERCLEPDSAESTGNETAAGESSSPESTDNAESPTASESASPSEEEPS